MVCVFYYFYKHQINVQRKKALCRSDISWLGRVWDRFLLTWIRFLRQKREGGGGLIIKLVWRKKKRMWEIERRSSFDRGSGKETSRFYDIYPTGFALNKRGGKYQQEFWGLPNGKIQGISMFSFLVEIRGERGKAENIRGTIFLWDPFSFPFPGHWGILIKSTMTKQKWRFYLLIYM